ncbi:hypothetical protein WA026_023459 [Henosepilachna vigintioctopunctata]|uniref:Uncharacterized protein n=1 Tax=Henosepilachna vigintioctopunctata TaxID=420089 RepID=A0AAW1VCU4_9CUCU
MGLVLGAACRDPSAAGRVLCNGIPEMKYNAAFGNVYQDVGTPYADMNLVVILGITIWVARQSKKTRVGPVCINMRDSITPNEARRLRTRTRRWTSKGTQRAHRQEPSSDLLVKPDRGKHKYDHIDSCVGLRLSTSINTNKLQRIFMLDILKTNLANRRCISFTAHDKIAETVEVNFVEIEKLIE